MCVCVSVSVFVFCLRQQELAGAGKSPIGDSQALCLTSSGRVLVFLCVSLVFQLEISHVFASAMAAGGFRHSGKSRAKSSTQGWSPIPGQVAEDASRNPDLVLASDHEQQSSASNFTLPEQQNQQAGTQTKSASPLHQTQGGSFQCQPTRNNLAPPTTDALGQYRLAGIDKTPLAADDLDSTVMVNAQLTHIISRDEAAQGHDAVNVPDAPMPDAPTAHDISTPRRMIGGRCCNWYISAQHASGKCMCAARSKCGIRFFHGEARLQQWGNRQTNHHYVHAHCVDGGLGHDHELYPKQSTDQDAVDAVTRQRDTITRTAADTEVLLRFVSGSGSRLNSRAT